MLRRCCREAPAVGLTQLPCSLRPVDLVAGTDGRAGAVVPVGDAGVAVAAATIRRVELMWISSTRS